MRLANLSPRTIEKRVEIVERFRTFLDGTELLAATPDDLRRFQATFEHRRPASIDIYVRHLRAFFQWAQYRGLIAEDPSVALISPKLPKRRARPMSFDEVRTIFAHTTGMLRMAFVFACFAGLRRGEMCRLWWQDIDLTGALPQALVHGKGEKDRMVPLLPVVTDELAVYGMRHSGPVLREHDRPVDPERLSRLCYDHVRCLGMAVTLHQGRHFAATYIVRLTKDPVLAKEILGHESLDTTMGYVEADRSDMHERLAAFESLAEDLRRQPRLRLVEG